MRSAGRSASPTVPQAAERTQLRASAWRSDVRRLDCPAPDRGIEQRMAYVSTGALR
jgi:hypothetical protein